MGTEEISFAITSNNRELVAQIYYPIGKLDESTTDYGIWSSKTLLGNAPIISKLKQYKLVVFSHGWQGDRFGNSWIAEKLINHGYIVVMIDHTHNTSYDHNDLFLYTSMWQRPADISALITYLADHVKWRQLINFQQIAVGGFSLGGLTSLWLGGIEADAKLFKEATERYSRWDDWPKASRRKAIEVDWKKAEYSYYDSRVKAIFSIAPDLGKGFEINGLKKMKLPTLLIVGDMDKITPAVENASFYASNIPNAQLLTINGAGHFTFLNNCSKLGLTLTPNLCSDDPLINRSQIHEQVGDNIVKFLEHNL
jgi:predicted dienelactone hydrolase